MARKPQENPQLDMTPMIDVVFELIIFFVVTIKQQDILSKLNVNRPAPSSSSAPSDKDDDTCKIDVDPDGIHYLLTGKENNVYDLKGINKYLEDIARKASRPEETPVIITSAKEAPHRSLVKLLDCCYAHKLYSISLFTM